MTTNIVFTIIALIFYIFLTIFVLYSILAGYALLRFGRSKALGIIISLLYLLFSASLSAAALGNLNNLKF